MRGHNRYRHMILPLRLSFYLISLRNSRSFTSTGLPAGTDQICGPDRFPNVRQLLDGIPMLDVVSATRLIGRFARQERYQEAFSIFSGMIYSKIHPNEFTFGTVLNASAALEDLSLSKQLHGCAIKEGFESNVFVGSSILDCYVKLGTIDEARKSFEDTRQPNVVSRTTLIYGYLKWNKFEDALSLFKELPERNVVSWNAMIGGCSQTGRNEEAMNLFVEMLRAGMVPNESTFASALTAISNVASIGSGRNLHGLAMKFLGQQLNVFISNSLISFYAKCGVMEDCLLVFNKLQELNVVSWNAVICGYAQNGRGEEAVRFFETMRSSGFKPNGVTLLGLLWGCNHTGLVDEGYLYFKQARKEEPCILKPEHYACMVDLLSRSGRFVEAEEFISNLPFDPGIGFWKAILGGCQIHSNIRFGEFAARKILELDPGDVSSYVMLSNAHSAAGRWQNVSSIRREMREKGLIRVPGCSWIEVRSKVHVFVTGDKKHDLKDGIFGLIRIFGEHLSEIESHSLPLEPLVG